MSGVEFRAATHFDRTTSLIGAKGDMVADRSNRPAGRCPAPGNEAAPRRQYAVDFSLALINRTGAYFVSRDLLCHLPQYFTATHYWRLRSTREPQGLVRFLMGRTMLLEITFAAKGNRRYWPRGLTRRTLPTLFLDPLYVLRSDLKREDIVLCHDIGPISHPDLFDATAVRMYKRAYDRIFESRTGIVFVSEASRRTFIAHYGTDFRFLTVIPLYVRRGIELEHDTEPLAIRKPFLLTVGALETRKNYPSAIEAFRQSGLADRGYSYVLCGPRGNAADKVEKLARTTPSVQAIGYRSDAELRWLYRNASGLVLPSLLEGFGLPTLEAARHQLLSVVSAGTAQEEAMGGGAVLVDPLSVTSIADGMRKLVEMTGEEREAKLALAMQRVQELTLDAYIARWADLLGAP